MADIAAVTSIEITAKDTTRGAFDSLRGSVNGLGKDVAGLTAAFGGMATLVGSAFLTAMLRQVTEAAAALDDLADSTGSSVENLSALANTARISGVDFGTFATMMNKLAVGLSGVGEEGSKAARALTLLGVQSKDPASALQELAASLDKYADGADKAALLTAIFGKTGAQFAGMLKDLARDGAVAATVTSELAAQAEELQKAWTRTKISIESVVTAIAGELVPAINGAIEDLKAGTKEAGGFWTALINLGLTNPFKDLVTRQRELRDEIEATNRKFYQLATDGAGEGTLGVVEQRIKDLTNQLAQLNREQLRTLQMLTGPSTYDARDLRLLQKPAAPNLGGGDSKERVDTLAKAYANLERQLLETVAATAKLGEVERLQIKLSSGEFGKLTEAQRERLLGIAKTIEAIKEEAQASRQFGKDIEALIRAEEEILEVERQLHQQATAAIGDYADENARLELEISLMGASNLERERALILMDAEVQKKKLIAAGDMQGLAILEKLIEKRLEFADTRATFEAQQAQTAEMVRLWESVDRAAEDAFTNILQGGKNAFDRLKDALQNGLMALLYQLTVRPFIVNIAAAISGDPALAGALGGLTGGGGLGGGGGNLLSLLSGAGSLFGGGGTLFGGSLAGGGIFSSGLGATFATSALGEGLGLTVAMGAGEGLALTALGSMLGTAIPVIGAVLAIAALAGAFDRDPSQVQGRFGITSGEGGFEDNAFTKSPFGNLGFLDEGTKYFSGDAAQVFNTLVGDTLAAFASRMDTSQIESLADKLQGMDFGSFEGEYTTQEFIEKYGGEILQKVISTAFGELDPALQAVFDAFKGTADEAAEFANVLLTVHDLTKTIPTDLRETLIAALDGTAEMSEQVIAFAGAYLTLQEVMNRDPLEDALNAIAAASDSAYVSLMKQADAFEELIEAYDGSAAASEEIAQATVDYYNALVNVIAGIRQLRTSIGEMFDKTIEDMMLETMSDADKGTYYANQIDLLSSQLSTATDPAEIERITSQINEYMRAAFGLLTPEEQVQMLDQYTSFAREIAALADERLLAAEEAAQARADALFAQLRSVLEGAANDMKVAGADMKQGGADTKSAANTLLAAVRTPITVVIETDDVVDR